MTANCSKPVAFETLADYLLGGLAEKEEREVESHLFHCASCASRTERLAGLQFAIASAVPPVLSRARFAELEREGRVEHVNPMAPGETARVVYPSPGRLLVHRFGGADLRQARRVDVELRTLGGESIGRFDDVPFDAGRGEVLVACQAHFVDLYPRDGVFAVEVVAGVERKEAARYTVIHRLA